MALVLALQSLLKHSQLVLAWHCRYREKAGTELEFPCNIDGSLWKQAYSNENRSPRLKKKLVCKFVQP